MDAIFLKLLNMSITASYLVILILVLRVIFPRIPRAVYCFLWAMVALRLVIPFSFESVLSLIPSTEPVPPEILYMATPAIHTGVTVLDQTVNPVVGQSLAPAPLASVNPLQVITAVCSWIWVGGMALMGLHTLVSWLKIRRKVMEAVPEDGFWSCDYIDTPFILGAFRPKIYLPSDMEPRDRFYVLAHEQAHLHRKDNLWKPMGYLLLTVYWFNPILWAAYIVFCRDIELACDEKVIRTLGRSNKKAYSEALIHCSTPKHLIAACPLAFGEVGVKKRIKTILHYRKPGFWILLIAVILCIATAVCFLTDPTEDDSDRQEAGDLLHEEETEVPEGTASQEEASETWDITLLIEDPAPGHVVVRLISSAKTPVQDYYQKPGYRLERKDGDGWVSLNSSPAMGEGSRIDLKWYSQEGNGLFLQWDDVPPLSPGSYRIGMEVSDGEKAQWIYGVFSLSPEESQGGFRPLSALPDPYTQEEADLDGCFIIADGFVTHGMDRWDAFFEKINMQEPAFLRLCKAPKFGDTVPVEEIYDIEHDETGYTVTWLSEDGTMLTAHYSGLQHDMGLEPEAGYYDQWEKWYLCDAFGTFQEAKESGLPYLLIYENRGHTPTGLPFPENTIKVQLQYEGKTYVETKDPAAIEGLRELFQKADYCYGGIKTHNIDGQLNLIAEDVTGNFVKIELDPVWDSCRVGEDYYTYGAPDELPYIDRIWKQLGIDQWPQPVYDQIPEAFRDPHAMGGLWEPDCEEFINLREEPGGKKILTEIPKGETFTMLQWQDTYALVEYQGLQGWVHTGYIKAVN